MHTPDVQNGSEDLLDRLDFAGNARGRLILGFVLAFGVILGAVTLVARPGLNTALAVNLSLGLLLANAFIVLGLGYYLSSRALRIVRSDEAGARLRVRFAALFSLAAVLPAVVVALFFGALITRGIDSWFNARVQTVVENSATVARSYVDQQTGHIRDHLVAMAADLNTAAPAMASTPMAFGHFLADQALYHDFAAVYVIRGNGLVLASSFAPGRSETLLVPPTSTFQSAGQGDVIMRPFENADLIRALYRLDALPDTFLYVTRSVDGGILNHLREAESSLTAYRASAESRAQIQGLFALSYAETAFLVLFGAIWLGISAANGIAGPVARLVNAADRVASGDLRVRLPIGSEPEEIGVLSKAFNRMTGDLQTQQAALRAAGIEANSRRQFIETVLSGVSAGVISRDDNGDIAAINSQAEHLLRLPQNGLLGRDLKEFAPDLEEIALLALKSGVPVEQELDVDLGGERLHLRVRAGTLSDGGVVLTFDDITRLMAAQRNAAWRDVARRIAHEIKNPLTPIQLAAERLRRRFRKDVQDDLETFDRCTDTIIRQVTDIGRMVDEFSSFARMPAPKFESCALDELIRQAVFVQKVASSDIDVRLSDLPDIKALVDPRMMSQALANVLKNAAESVSTAHALSEHSSGRIDVDVEIQDRDFVIRILDNGLGLPAKDRDRLTEPYVTTREKGTGLGLAIVKRILEDHGGSLVLGERSDGPGARVEFILPKTLQESADPSAGPASIQRIPDGQ